MATTNPKSRPKKETPPNTRCSVSFPGELYRMLEDIARQKKVSLAWVVRDAAEEYLKSYWPLFDEKKRGDGR